MVYQNCISKLLLIPTAPQSYENRVSLLVKSVINDLKMSFDWVASDLPILLKFSLIRDIIQQILSSWIVLAFKWCLFKKFAKFRRFLRNLESTACLVRITSIIVYSMLYNVGGEWWGLSWSKSRRRVRLGRRVFAKKWRPPSSQLHHFHYTNPKKGIYPEKLSVSRIWGYLWQNEKFKSRLLIGQLRIFEWPRNSNFEGKFLSKTQTKKAFSSRANILIFVETLKFLFQAIWGVKYWTDVVIGAKDTTLG